MNGKYHYSHFGAILYFYLKRQFKHVRKQLVNFPILCGSIIILIVYPLCQEHISWCHKMVDPFFPENFSSIVFVENI